MTEYQPIIGLEVHVQLKTKSKLFCGCSADHFGKKPNTQVCPVCLGLPGTIPGPPNIRAIKKTVLVAKALNCQLAKECYFERKNYFYPDLPKGFQISQHRTAIGLKGEFKGLRIRRVHLEEDTAKLIHKKDATLIDFNRAGVPLMEVVSEPEAKDPDQIKAVLKELRILLRHLDVSDADMEKGSMRLEGNISLRKKGTTTLPRYRVELKNINSFTFLTRALEIEIERQRRFLEVGRKIVQETRGYDEKRNVTFVQRRKEEAFDYRYFPEPDLPPLTAKILTYEDKITLPKERRLKFEEEYQLPRQFSNVLAVDLELVSLFEEAIQASELAPREVANAIVNRRFGDPKRLGVRGLIKAIKRGKEKVKLPEAEIVRCIDKIFLDNPQAVRDYEAGKEEALNFLLGKLMKETKGRVDPSEAKKALVKAIKSMKPVKPVKAMKTIKTIKSVNQ